MDELFDFVLGNVKVFEVSIEDIPTKSAEMGNKIVIFSIFFFGLLRVKNMSLQYVNSMNWILRDLHGEFFFRGGVPIDDSPTMHMMSCRRLAMHFHFVWNQKHGNSHEEVCFGVIDGVVFQCGQRYNEWC